MVIPELSEMGSGIEIVSCQVTDEKMYLKVINKNLEAAISVGDPVQAGFILSNGEIGNASVSVEPFIYRLVCTNGMILKDKRQRKNHAGRANENADLYASDTLQAIMMRSSSRFAIWSGMQLVSPHSRKLLQTCRVPNLI
ncbi:MAG: DUF932 domain-containing protein [Chamaesiphon sp. CSU_1_12]|nr:DUF932 domain-containing protein [Chamaesiphon sp. CSU_1_12]